MPSPEGQRRARSVVRWLELGALVAAGLFALVFQLRLPGRIPVEAEHQQAAELIRAQAQEGDVVVLYPWWAEHPRLFLPSSVRVVSSFESATSAFPDAKRIWLYAQPDLPRSDLPAFEQQFASGRRLVSEQAVGRLRLKLYENGRAKPKRFSAADAVASAHVYLDVPGRGRVDCPFDGQTHRCPNAPAHLRVATEWHEVFYEARRCLWMHPPGGAAKLVAEFPAVPEGDELILEAGVIWEWASRVGPQFTPVNVGVDDVGSGKTLLDVSIPPGLEPLQRASVQTTGAAASPMRVWIQSDRATERATCVEVVRRSARPAEAM